MDSTGFFRVQFDRSMADAAPRLTEVVVEALGELYTASRSELPEGQNLRDLFSAYGHDLKQLVTTGQGPEVVIGGDGSDYQGSLAHFDRLDKRIYIPMSTLIGGSKLIADALIHEGAHYAAEVRTGKPRSAEVELGAFLKDRPAPEGTPDAAMGRPEGYEANHRFDLLRKAQKRKEQE